MKALQRRATGVISMPTKGQPYIPGVEVVVEIIEIVETCRYSTMGMLRAVSKSSQNRNLIICTLIFHDTIYINRVSKTCVADVLQA